MAGTCNAMHRAALDAQSGFSLIESVITIGLLIIVVAGTIAAFAGVAKVSSPDPYRESAQREMRRIIAIQSAIVKYSDPNTISVNATPWNTTMPFPNGTPVPITVQASKSTLAGGQPALTVAIHYPANGSTQTLRNTIALVRKAPNPDAGSRLVQPGFYADPNAAPIPTP
ncbi:MAG: hypothetical protein NVSMB31_18880 [Vulcanimicrobiaceae bacterium]